MTSTHMTMTGVDITPVEVGAVIMSNMGRRALNAVSAILS